VDDPEEILGFFDGAAPHMVDVESESKIKEMTPHSRYLIIAVP
jgi:hypothetical protein